MKMIILAIMVLLMVLGVESRVNKAGKNSTVSEDDSLQLVCIRSLMTRPVYKCYTYPLSVCRYENVAYWGVRCY